MKSFFKAILRKNFPIIYLKLFYFKATKKLLNIHNPRTFDEKIHWLKLFELPDNDLVVKCADKLLLSNYLEEKGLAGINAKLLGYWNRFEEIDFNKLPNQFVLKTNNASGTNFFCKDKTQLDKEILRHKIKEWLVLDFGEILLEKHYSKIQPKILVEEYLDFSSENIEYNFYCFNGNVKFCKVVSFDDKETKKGKGRCYDYDWRDLKFDYPENLLGPIEKPREYDHMIDICQQISKDFKFVRIDFFQCTDRVVLGELTFTPAAGVARGFNDEAQKIMGEWLNFNFTKK